MIRYFVCFFFVISSIVLTGQGNAASFDGTSGYVDVPQASAFITDQGMTIEGWVFPRNENPGWPNFDGIMGIRNEADCDFYVLQLSPTEVEARFRNSDGEEFTIINGGLEIGVWNHIALSLDDGFLTYYLNGEFQQVIEAQGNCAVGESPLTLGKLNFDGTTDFYFDGMLDEVRFWLEGRSETEIEEMYNCKIENPAEFSTLGFFYNLDESEGSLIVSDGGNVGINGLITDTVTFVESTVDYKVANTVTDIEADISIYPNPSSGAFTISSHSFEFSKLVVWNYLGQKVIEESPSENEKIKITGLAVGQYQIELINDQATVFKTLIVVD